jgi:ATP/ADP translocase
VVALSLLAALALAGLNLLFTGQLSLFFDLTFVVLCLVAALAVRPRDFFVVGVLPPLLMLATVVLLASFARTAVAEEVDGLAQAVVSGLAHHAGALVAGYALALVVLALRQVALRNAGLLRQSRQAASSPRG